MVMEKTIAWFWGIYSFIPSHMAASTRVNFLETGVDEGFPLSCGSACEKRKKSIQSSTKRRMDNLHFMTRGLLLKSYQENASMTLAMAWVRSRSIK